MNQRLMLLALVTVMVQGCASGNVSRMPDGQVKLSVFKPFAADVVLCTSTTGFDSHTPVSKTLGSWLFTVSGHDSFAYFFLVDGEVFVPDCVFRENDDFGRYNCLFSADM